MKIQVTVHKSTEKDSWNAGCDPESGQYFGCIDQKEFKSIEDAIRFVASFGEPFIFDDRLEVQVYETNEGYAAEKASMDDFKAGRLDLWLANYSFYFARVERIEFGHGDLVSAFPFLSAEAAS